MKLFLIRLSIYIPVISFFWWIFVPDFFSPGLFEGNALAHLPGYMAYYGVTYGFWIAAYELCYRAAVYVRKPKPAPVPETQPLSAVQQASNPTRPIDRP